MRKYVDTYMSFVYEAEEEKKEDSEDKVEPSKKKTISPDVAKRISNRVMKKGMKDVAAAPGVKKGKDGKPVVIPKDIQLKDLVKQLYKAQYDVATYKYVLADKIAAMKRAGADEDTVAKAEEMGADQMANVQLRSDAINAQMIALAGQNANLALKAEELAQGAINAALKAAQDFYDKRAQKWLKDSEASQKEKEKEGESSAEKDEKSDK